MQRHYDRKSGPVYGSQRSSRRRGLREMRREAGPDIAGLGGHREE